MFATRKCDRNYSDLSTMTIIFSPITCYLRLAKTTIYSNLKSCGWILCIYSGKLRNPLRIHDVALFTQPSQRHIITAAAGMWIKFPGNGRVDSWNPHDASENVTGPLPVKGLVARKGKGLSFFFWRFSIDGSGGREMCIRKADVFFKIWLKSVFNFTWQDVDVERGICIYI